MTEDELKAVLSANIKKYREGRFTQETLAEKLGVSSQNINDIEGRRRFPRTDTLVKIAEALDVEVYQLFMPRNSEPVVIEENDETERIRGEIQKEVIEDVRLTVNRALDRMRQDFIKKH